MDSAKSEEQLLQWEIEMIYYHLLFAKGQWEIGSDRIVSKSGTVTREGEG